MLVNTAGANHFCLSRTLVRREQAWLDVLRDGCIYFIDGKLLLAFSLVQMIDGVLFRVIQLWPNNDLVST